MTPYEEETLAKNLAGMWQIAADNETRIAGIFANGIQDAEDAKIVRLMCLLVVGEIRYEQKELQPK